jgi:hypothetical protein
MSLQLEGNHIVSNGVSHPISSCSLDDYLDYRFTIRYLDRVCYVLNPLETPVKIVLFYGSESRDGISKVTLPPGIGIIKVCSQSVPRVYSHHMSLAGISIGHQLIRLTHTHDSKQVVIIATTSPPYPQSLRNSGCSRSYQTASKARRSWETPTASPSPSPAGQGRVGSTHYVAQRQVKGGLVKSIERCARAVAA